MVEKPGQSRAADPDDVLAFHDLHEPTLGIRDYTVTYSHLLEATADDTVKGSGQLHLRVSGPQLTLPAGSVEAIFPANLSADRYYQVLPHVVLSRGTLPWERDPRVNGRLSGNKKKPPLPWMVLLILDEDELAARDITTVVAKNVPAPISASDTHVDDQITLLELDASVVASHLPPLDDLQWLAHVRRIEPPGQEPLPETATIVANRLPTPGKENHALLISVEARYGQEDFETHGHTHVQVPVLHQWSFFCEDEPAHGFNELLTKRDGHDNDPKPFILPGDHAVDSQERIEAGFVPVEHRLRNGDVSAGWYHGPLLPGHPPVDSSFVEDKLPADHADDLLLFDEAFAMFDVSYACAWELGRMLALEHTDIATALYQWKRQFASTRLRSQDHGVQPIYTTASGQQLPGMPSLVADWLRTGIVELRDVPFRNLVPDEAMLPPSAFRFFDVDAGWVECLRDGAVSVGRTFGNTRKLENELRDHLPRPPEMSGFLLRNSAVTDFPHLEVDGYSQGAGSAPAVGEFSKAALPIVRMERLSPSVLIVIFAGRVKTVDLHLHPQALHFGLRMVSGHPGSEVFEKDDPAGDTVTVGHGDAHHDATINAARRVAMAELAMALKVGSGDGAVARFSAAMLEGVPLARFSRKVSK